MFRRSEYTAEIEENGADLKFVTVVTAQSQSSVSFDISAGNFDDAFLVNPTSGVVKARFPLDFEVRPFYNLTVRARNVAPAAELATLLVHVIDVNDNAPVFETLEYGGSTTEVASSGSFVLDSNSAPLVVRARDADSDRNALLTYSLVNDDLRGIFDVDASTGAVKVGDLARLNAGGRTFTFQVQVQDAGSPPLFAADVASVTVNVTDVNNSPPLFERRLYEATLLLPTYVGVQVLQVSASDADTGIAAELVYSIARGNDAGHLTIDSHTGAITVRQPDAMFNDYELSVKVSDGKFEEFARVVINVDLSQDSGLRFTRDEYRATIAENSTRVEQVAVVQATGHDLNEFLSFAILNPSSAFEVGDTSGVVRSTGLRLDREEREDHVLVVEVVDARRPPRRAHTLVRIHVIDKNDNAPVFVELPYYTVTSLDASVGDLVREASAFTQAHCRII